MELLIKLFEAVFPVFFIIGIGYYLGKKNPKIDTAFITNFAANIGSPGLIFYSITSTGITFELFSVYFFYALVVITGFALVGLVFLFFQRKDLVTELPPFILPNTGNITKSYKKQMGKGNKFFINRRACGRSWYFTLYL